MRLELTETIDVSREGLLIRRDDACEAPSRVWIAFPFDAAAPAAMQPETPARIVRAEPQPGGGFRVGLRLELPPRDSARPAGQERRTSSRVLFALPIFVRHAGTPWPEESMTQDISQSGARFETSQIYCAGDAILATLPWGEWAKGGEIPGRVVRVAPIDDIPGSAPVGAPPAGASPPLTSVAVQWTRTAKP